LKKIFFRAII